MDKSPLLFHYFATKTLMGSSIHSYNHFVEKGMQQVVDENKEAEPAIIPHNIERFVIRFGKISMGKPEITEADGSKRPIFPSEARLRKISYSAPLYLEVSTHINDIQRESFTAQIGRMPVMLKGNNCHLAGLSRDELIRNGEDPDDPGGYFIINGTERVIVTIEDLAPNNFTVEEGDAGFVGKIFSERGAYRIPHTIEKKKDEILYLSFTRIKRIPIVLVLKALGMLRDDEIMKAVSTKHQYNEMLINLFEFADVKDQEEALDLVAKKMGVTQAKEIRLERARDMLNRYLLPHLGVTDEERMAKAYNICKLVKKYLRAANNQVESDDKDHYLNKRLKQAGDLLMDLFRVNFKVLEGDLLYNFQRIIKRGKLPSIKVIFREKLLTSRIYSSMATGAWVGGRKGISQRMDRTNFLATISHLQRVVSPLSTSQENFEARALHPTHLGRLCPIETPEGTNIGLRKNLALLCSISPDVSEEEVREVLKKHGVVML